MIYLFIRDGIVVGSDLLTKQNLIDARDRGTIVIDTVMNKVFNPTTNTWNPIAKI